jgi:hypothetical protein
MSTRRWRGDAPAIAQVTAWVFGGTWEANDIVNVTINGKVVSVVTGSTVIATLLDTLVTALNASTIPEFAEITWSRSTSTLVATADTAGKPFTATASTTETGGTTADDQTIDGSDTSAGTDSTVCTGPNWWSNAANWSGAAVPVSTDDVFIDEGSSDIKYGLAQSAVTLTSLTIDQKYTGKIGLPVLNADGSTSYFEYRATYLAISATTLNIGRGDGSGSGRIKIDTGSNASTLNLLNAGTAAEQGRAAVIWKGAHASNVLNVTKGTLDVAPFPGEVATVPVLRVGYSTNQNGDSTVRCYSGVTLTTITQTGGTLQIDGAATTINQSAGELIILNGAVTTLNVDGGACRYRSAGTITTLRVGTNATADYTQNNRPRTITNLVAMYSKSKLWDDAGTVTFSAGVKPTGCQLGDIELRVGQNRTVAVS